MGYTLWNRDGPSITPPNALACGQAGRGRWQAIGAGQRLQAAIRLHRESADTAGAANPHIQERLLWLSAMSVGLPPSTPVRPSAFSRLRRPSRPARKPEIEPLAALAQKTLEAFIL